MSNSFSKFFPHLFSNKSKNKNKSQEVCKIQEKLQKNNDKKNFRSSSQRLSLNTEDAICSDVIYENLVVPQRKPNRQECNLESSDSTLVPDNTNTDLNIEYRKDQNLLIGNEYRDEKSIQQDSNYPDIYFHSVDNINDPALFNNIELCYINNEPVSVGAEIKKVNTPFNISPKKHADVRTRKPNRASIFVDEKNSLTGNIVNDQYSIVNRSRSYDYSAPLSQSNHNRKMPTMPETVSPYGYVRKQIQASESNKKIQNKSYENIHDSAEIYYRKKTLDETYCCSKFLNPNLQFTENTISKEKTRDKVEAFYWQKLKEQKLKEDACLFQQTCVQRPDSKTDNLSAASVFHTKTTSLPRGLNLRNDCATQTQSAYEKAPFIRGAPERKTDTAIYNRKTFPNKDIIYRHSEKINSDMNKNNHIQTPIFQRGSLTHFYKNTSTCPKNVSFQDTKDVDINITNKITSNETIRSNNLVAVANYKTKPPQPPSRTYSVKTDGNSQVMKTPVSVKNVNYLYADSESGSEASEIKRILQNSGVKEDDWHPDGSRGDGGLSDGETTRGQSRARTSRRDDPRRHTLAGNHFYLQTSHHPGYLNSMDMESQLSRGYQQPSNTMLYDDDPGIMSEVETASTGFRRGGKQRSSLPVVRTLSKTLERPLGLVFLQYRSETKRALLPNEITSIDTVKALFVRSFPKQLTMQYMDSPMVKIYIHDSSKNMFYELEDVRSHLRDIKDRSVLRLFEAADVGGGGFPGAVGAGSMAMPPGAISYSGPASFDQDQNYFSEPEIDSEYHHHQHVHKSKVKTPAYYMGNSAPRTLPRGSSIIRAFSPAAAPVPADRILTVPGTAGDGYMSSPERAAARPPYEDPYYMQYLGPAAGRTVIAPMIEEQANEEVLLDDSYSMYGVNSALGPPRPAARAPFDARLNSQGDDLQRLRVEKMERQLANLTGLVQQALVGPSVSPLVAPRQEFQYETRPTQDTPRFGSTERPPKLGKDKFQKSVSFEKSVSFCDDPPDMNSPKQHSPQHSADTKPTKPAIKSSTLPRTSSQERDRLKPAPPPKPAGLIAPQMALMPQRTYNLTVTPEFFAQLRLLQKQSRDLKIETLNLRRSTLTHAMQMRQMMADTIIKLGALVANQRDQNPDSQLSREEEIYRQDMLLLENDLYEIEATVEKLRGKAANREARVNVADVEHIALVLSKSSKTVSDWKLKFPILQETMKMKLNAEMEKVVRKEKLLEEEPERLELALRRCKKLTGTLVTLKRLACVQEQRLPDGRLSPESSQSSTFCSTVGPSSEEFASDRSESCHIPIAHNKFAWRQSTYFKEAIIINELAGSARSAWHGAQGDGGGGRADQQRGENALDALLDELQTFSKPADGALRRLHSYPSGSDTDASPPVRARGHHPPKPPLPIRHPALVARRPPPPPPPRTTSRSPLASPPSPASPTRSVAVLDQRHQELLKKQKALQEQYARLQMIQRSGAPLPNNTHVDLKKTGSESNLLSRMNLNLAPASLSGSLTHLASVNHSENSKDPLTVESPQGDNDLNQGKLHKSATTTNKVYETDIL